MGPGADTAPGLPPDPNQGAPADHRASGPCHAPEGRWPERRRCLAGSIKAAPIAGLFRSLYQFDAIAIGVEEVDEHPARDRPGCRHHRVRQAGEAEPFQARKER
jgi:hypothetical protein